MSINTSVNVEISLSVFQEEELCRLAGTQLSNGALPMTSLLPGESIRVCPYFSSFAALALLCDPLRYAENVRQYMDWHFSHLNTADKDVNRQDGTIYDYLIRESNGIYTETPLCDGEGRPTYDSTDSYAALFLVVLAEYAEKTGDRQYLTRHTPEIQRVVSAMLSTLNNGLTRAKPDYPVKYTMDNSETAWGLRAALRLCGWVPGLNAGFLHGILANLLQTMERSLWNRDQGYYEVGLDGRDLPVVPVFDWRQFYPDAMAQAFPILTEILPPDSGRAEYLYHELLRYYPPSAINGDMLINASLLSLTAARMNDAASARQYLAVHQAAFCRPRRPETITCQGYAFGILTASSLRKQEEEKMAIE